jgi:hypothetical protein
MTTEADDWNARHTTEPNIWQQLQELIDQSGRDEIIIQQQADRIRDLEAKLELAQEIATKEEMMLDCYVPDWHKVFAHDTAGMVNRPTPWFLHRDR